MSHIIVLFVQFIPEAIAVAFCATVFLKVAIDKRIIVGMGLTVGIVVYLFRALPITFGFHTIFGILLYTILLTYFYQKRILSCFLSVLKPLILISICEIFTANILTYIINKPIEEIINDPLLKTIAMLPQIIFVFLVGTVILWLRNKGAKSYEL